MCSSVDVSANGYIDHELAYKWMVDFEKATRPAPMSNEADEWRLLSMDNFGSHLTLAVIDYAVQHHIKIVGYISHSTHVLQGLDVTCFRTFKTLYGRARQWYE